MNEGEGGLRLKDRTVVVTGGARGIGRHIAQVVIDEGGQVVVADLSALDAEWFERNAGRAVFVRADVSRQDEIAQVVALTNETFGRLDGWVNNAMITRAEPFLDIPPESWKELLDVGLTGYFYGGQTAARHFVDQRTPGSIVNMASVNSLVAEKNAAHYVAVKGGVAALTRAMSVDLAGYGIRVNAVAPGLIETEKTRAIFQSPEHRTQIGRIPLGRPGTAEEVARLVVFLLSDEASYITGEMYKVDGGILSVLS